MIVVINLENILPQSETDSVSNNSIDSLNYRFKLSLEPQDGYTFILGFTGSLNDNIQFYDFEIGIARTIISKGHEGDTIDRIVTLGLISQESELFYLVGFGYNFRSILDFGLFLKFINNFNGSNTFSLRPHIGFIFLPPVGSAYIEIGYNINFLKNNYDIPNNFVGGIRYNIGFLINEN